MVSLTTIFFLLLFVDAKSLLLLTVIMSLYIVNFSNLDKSCKLLASFGLSWLWLCDSLIYNYLCNQCSITTEVVSSNPAHGEV